MNAVKYVKKNCPDMHIIGNIHSHAQYQAFWSEGIAIVGLYRTSPSGSPDFNLLDNKTLDDMLTA